NAARTAALRRRATIGSEIEYLVNCVRSRVQKPGEFGKFGKARRTIAPGTRSARHAVGCPALRGAVKTERCRGPVVVVLTAGVRSQSRHQGPGHVAHAHVTSEGAARGDVWPSVLQRTSFVRGPADREAVVMFSRHQGGNHPALWASGGHGFI